MYRIACLLVVAFLTFGCRVESAIPDAVAPDGPLAIVGVTVIPMDSEALIERQTILVEGDRIVAVGADDEIDVPSNATLVDGAGRYVIPGLAEMHGHIPPPTAPREYIENVLFLYVANGVTTVRGMLGHDGQLELKREVFDDEVIGPALYLAGPSFNGNSVRSPEQAERKVRRQADEGWDLLKIHPGMSRASYDRMAETAQELEMRFGGHVPEDVGLLHALEMGQETFDHLDGYVAYLGAAEREVSDEELRAIARKTIEHGAMVVPTMALWESLWGVADASELASYPELKYMPPDEVRSWANRYRQRSAQADKVASTRVIETRMRLLKIMQEEGVEILFGTDAPQLYSVPGFSIHHETKRMAEAGLTPFEILLSATRNVGDYFADQDDFGTIAAGKRADLVLLASNPLEDIANLGAVEGVVLRGKWLSGDDIKSRLAQIAESHQ
ncbi:MAG: amidohydrolase family protein [Rhodothermia bacterium]|nr:amidohydrolase family protein [Rhodothermia bacterium]